MAGSGRRSARSRVRYSADGSQDDSISGGRPHMKQHRDIRKGYGTISLIGVDVKVVLAICFFAVFGILFLIRYLVRTPEEASRPRVITPFPAPKLTELPQFQGEHKESMYWGTYRPHLYLGIRSRTPRSLLAGLMWIGVKDGRYSIRHICQDNDGLNSYGWISHNGRDFGHQKLVDQGMVLETSFLKSKNLGSGYGGDWAVRIVVQNPKSMQTEDITDAHVFFYLADEEGNALDLSRDSYDIHGNSLLASGSRMDIGNWQMHMKSKDDLEVHFSGFRTLHMHNLSDLVLDNLGEQAQKYGRIQLSDTTTSSPNVLVFQISARIPSKMDIVFLSGTMVKGSRVEERVSSLTGSSLTSQLQLKQREFDERFEKYFNLADKLDTESSIVGKAAIGNLLGGIGYFYGQSKISIPRTKSIQGPDKFVSYWPAELYTAVPSRSFFPRGFLWDEGFHQLLVWRWDFRICLDILGHWLDLMNIDGWIPREQILGAEALSKVPEEFVPQHPSNGNPPTLFLVLNDLVNGIKSSRFTADECNEILSFLEHAYVRLDAWFGWFNTTQSGKEKGSYFWHGRDSTTVRELNAKTLTSGLDDYPRASHPSEDERHVDLRCWMLLAADCMHSIAKLVNKEANSGKVYGETAELLSDFEIINQMHFDSTHGAYLDFGNHTEKVRLSWKEVIGGNNDATRELVREVLQMPELRLVPHIGYVSLFPFMGKIIPTDSWILDKQFDLISNKSTLWTDFGLRSLARTSTLYMKRNTEHDPPYWRGPIWMNMNYLILSALDYYSKDGPYRDRAEVIYNDLRGNLIRNVVRNYRETGFLWEQYDQKQGKGKGCRPFTGWTSLILLVMSESYGSN
ncbi:hypothetical protein SAY87_013828 [Trapa incisa]|uniref:Mannosyl-oligosaccharide glucosidase n=2 Tax=Trapa incisa TaxID=236973 RepID=A0AAN7QGK0_9MYRT|nr:hypothetical protein SAY87_013828 [Trapa incisa]